MPSSDDWFDDEFRLCPGYGRRGDTSITEECDGTCTVWVAHSHPERPLAYGASVCDCAACVASIRTAARVGLDIGLVLKSGMDRQVITLGEAIEAMDEHGDEYGMDIVYLRHPEDYMREIYVVAWPRGWPRRRLLILSGGDDLEVYDGQRIS